MLMGLSVDMTMSGGILLPHMGIEGESHGTHQHERQSFELPEELAAFLHGEAYAMLLQASSEGTLYVVKIPEHELAGMTGTIPMAVSHELYQHPRAPVIRSVVHLYDQPDQPLALETFTNVRDAQQRADFAGVADQDEQLFLFYDETLSHRLTKRLPNRSQEQMSRILTYADRVATSIPPSQFDFDATKADVLERTEL